MSNTTRRRFLNSSLGVAAALSAGSAFAAEAKSTTKPTSQPTTKKKPTTRSISGANNRINIAIIGCGDRGSNHVNELLSLGDHVNIVALCDPDESRLTAKSQTIEDETGIAPRTYQDIRKLLEDKEVQAVTIATTNHWHSLAGIWAIQAGKDAYIEKPISHNIFEGRRVVEAARKHNRIVLHGTQARSAGAMQQAMRFIHEGNLGKIFLARGLCYKDRKSIGLIGSDQPIPAGIDYDLWSGPSPVVPLHRKRLHYDWHWFWNTGNGDIGNQGVHQMDICCWGLNRHDIASRVQCFGGRLGYTDDAETPNTQIALFDFNDGAQVIFEVRGLESKPVPGAKAGVCNIFYGTEGSLVVNSYDNCSAYAPDGSPIEMPKYDLGSTGNHFTSFIKAIRSRKLDYAGGESEAGHVSASMCHLANISYRMGTKTPFSASTKAFGDDKAAHATLVRLESHLSDNGLKLEETDYMLGPSLQFDAKAERFTNNEAANRLLTREYRTPFVVPDHV